MYARFFALYYVYGSGSNRWQVIARSWSEDEVFQKLNEFLTSRPKGESGQHLTGDFAETMDAATFDEFVSAFPRLGLGCRLCLILWPCGRRWIGDSCFVDLERAARRVVFARCERASRARAGFA